MTQTILTIGIPTLAVLIGILLNRNDANRLDSRITSVEQNLRAEIASARKQSHEDIMLLVGIAREHGERITRVESRS